MRLSGPQLQENNVPLEKLVYPNYDKPVLNQEEFDNVCLLHEKWLRREVGGFRGDFSYQDISMCDLSEKDLRGACFMQSIMTGVSAHKAIFAGAHFQGAQLNAADFSFADLTQAQFVGATMTNINLFRVILSGTMGNGKEIKTISIGKYPCSYTSNLIQFACQRLPIATWVDIDDETLNKMDKNAKIYYNTYYSVLKDLIVDSAPAVESRYEDTRVVE